MQFSLSFLTRPVMAISVNLIIVIVGLVAFKQLAFRHAPDRHVHELQVITQFEGANSTVVEQRITKPIEDSLSGIDGIAKVGSESTDGRSMVSIKFASGINAQTVIPKVRDRITQAAKEFPEGVEKPLVFDQGENEEDLLYIAFTDPSRSLAGIADYVVRNIKEPMQLIEGVAAADLFSHAPYILEIQIDPAELFSHEITVEEILASLKKEKVFATGGQIDFLSRKKPVVIVAPLASPNAFEDITLVTRSQKIVRLKEIAEVTVSKKRPLFEMSINGEPITGISIKAKPQANPLTVAKEVHAYVEQLTPSLPGTMKAEVVYDRTIPFEHAIENVHRSIWEAVILVAVIMTVSLASFRAALLPIITIPLCLIGTMFCMWVLNFSINPVSLLAMVLAVGLVVDDAIVVVENIHKHMEKGLSVLASAKAGMQEISFSVIVMTLTLAAVYMPVAFQADDSAVLFKEFAWTLAASVLISGFVALTLTPALSVLFFKEKASAHFALDQHWDTLSSGYEKAVRKLLKRPILVCAVALFIVGLALWGGARLPSELSPTEDIDFLNGYLQVENDVPPVLTDKWYHFIYDQVAKMPEVLQFMEGRFLDFTFWNLFLTPSAQRSRSAGEIAEALRPSLQTIVGPEVGVAQPEAGFSGDEGLKVVLHYPGEYQELLTSVKGIVDALEDNPLFQRVWSKELTVKSRLKIRVDRALASDLGVSISTIEKTLTTYLSGAHPMDFTFNGYDYEVIVRGGIKERTAISKINEYFVTGRQNQSIPLGSLVSIEEVREPSAITRVNRQRSSKINFTLAHGVSLARAIEIIEPVVKQQLPQDAQYFLDGKGEKYKAAKKAMLFTFILALAFIYLLLSALFESFILPFVVLITVPLSVCGAVFLVWVMGGSNNIYTQIGLVTLVGLITKHGILIVDFANRLKEGGAESLEAVIMAAKSRFRPILMTTFAMVFGAIPLVMGVGSDAMARAHIGWVIIGGLISGTIFSLFVVPVVYRLLARTAS